MKKLLSSVSLIALLSAPSFGSDMFANRVAEGKKSSATATMKASVAEFNALLQDQDMIAALRAVSLTADQAKATAEQGILGKAGFNPFKEGLDFEATDAQSIATAQTELQGILDQLNGMKGTPQTPGDADSNTDDHSVGSAGMPPQTSDKVDDLRASTAGLTIGASDDAADETLADLQGNKSAELWWTETVGRNNVTSKRKHKTHFTLQNFQQQLRIAWKFTNNGKDFGHEITYADQVAHPAITFHRDGHNATSPVDGGQPAEAGTYVGTKQARLQAILDALQPELKQEHGLK